MGFLDRFRKGFRLPEFQACLFGKLPCHKEYFFVSTHPAFSELKRFVDEGFQAIIRQGHERPYVCPDRRFYIRMDDRKTDLAGCIWESDDGLRGFPFVLAAPIPRKLGQHEFSFLWQVLEQLWRYLEAYYDDLHQQHDASGVYNRVRGVVHGLPHLTPLDWNLSPTHMASQAAESLGRGFAKIELSGLSPEAETHLIRGMTPAENPAFVLWPSPTWRDQTAGPVFAYLGLKGLADLQIGFFPRHPETGEDEAALEPIERPVEEDTARAGGPVDTIQTPSEGENEVIENENLVPPNEDNPNISELEPPGEPLVAPEDPSEINTVILDPNDIETVNLDEEEAAASEEPASEARDRADSDNLS